MKNAAEHATKKTLVSQSPSEGIFKNIHVFPEFHRVPNRSGAAGLPKKIATIF